MINLIKKKYLQPRRMGLLLVVTLLAGMMVAQLPLAPAQTNGPEKKADKAPPAAKQPKVVDILAGTGGLEQVAFINQMLEKSWQENKIVPAERCTDYEFIRRASLDIIGRIATIKEMESFLTDPPERRRSRLIERLLGNPEFLQKKGPDYGKGEEYAHNWANIWTVLLLTRTGVPNKPYQEQLRDWLSEKLLDEKKTETTQAYIPDWSKIVSEILSAQGKTNDNGAVNFILAHLGERINQDNANSGKYDMIPLTSRTTRLFLGLRTQCVQCHDHPFNSDWRQEHFWGINAFFRQVDPTGRPTMMAPKKKEVGMPQYNLTDDPQFNVKGLVPYERRSGVLLYTDATFLDGQKMSPIKGATRRQQLAKFIVGSPYFAKAYVNRTWGHFFGRSFTKDNVDDFGEHNPITHPELFEKLCDDWATKYSYNPKVLIRWICNSRAYGLSSASNATNDKPEDETFFARMLLKPMMPEQLFESLMTATESPLAKNKTAKAALRESWMQKLIVKFGDDEGNEGSFSGTVVQALILMNGSDINDAIMNKQEGTVAYALASHPPVNEREAGKVLNVLFRAALNRPPTTKEIEKILSPKVYSYRPGVAGPRDGVAFWTGYCQDVFWALLNSNEFILNH